MSSETLFPENESEIEAFVRRSLHLLEQGWKLDEEGHYTVVVGKEVKGYFTQNGTFLATRKNLSSFAPMEQVNLSEVLPPHFKFRLSEQLDQEQFEEKVLSYLEKNFSVEFPSGRQFLPQAESFRAINAFLVDRFTGAITPLILFYSLEDSGYYMPRIYDLAPFLEKGARW